MKSRVKGNDKNKGIRAQMLYEIYLFLASAASNPIYQLDGVRML